MDDCIFCKIINKEIPAHFVYESDQVVAFPDIHPSADLHLLIVPKEHIKAFKDLTTGHGDLLAEIYQTASKLVLENNLEEGAYRVVVNGGKAQQIPHLHFHLLGGKWQRRV